MGCLSSDRFHARKKSVLLKLVKGRESAVQLRTILHEPAQHQEPVLVQQLALQIFRSLSDSVSELSSCTGSTESNQIPAVDCTGSASSGESKKKPGVKDRRGCYKRRKTADSWVTVSPSQEDGCAWRKYGQKTILNSEYPRCYFRCTHKNDGCKALKQVQRVKGDQLLYQTTYFNHHSCKQTLALEPSHPLDPTLISFQHDHKNSSKPLILSSVKQDDSLSDAASNEARSSLEDPWHDIIGLEPLGYKPVWTPFQHEVESSLDMEVNQLSDMVNLQFFS